jgi:hypothetical protein
MYGNKPVSLLKLMGSFLLVFSYIQGGQSFVNHPRSVAHNSASRNNIMPPTTTGSLKVKHGEMMQPLKAQVDGTGRGLVIQGIVLALCIWIFSIPPEFRRAHICPDSCLENREMCYDCVSAEEWRTGISEYYKNGGGIQFNFEVAQETKAAWSK